MTAPGSIDVTVSPANVDDLVRSIRKHADKKGLRKDLNSGLMRATKNVRGEMKEVVPAALPTRGGLSEEVRGSLRSRVSAKSGRNPGVAIRFSSSTRDVRTLTGQRLRHPVFGNKSVWVEQTEGVEPAVFMGKFEDQKPEIQREISHVLEDIARRVTGDVKLPGFGAGGATI